MNDNSCPTCHDPSLPVLRIARDGILDQLGAKLTPGGVRVPTAFTVVIVNDRAYGVWRAADRQCYLVHDIKDNRLPEHRSMEPVNIVIARHGQKLKISDSYFIVDAATDYNAAPLLRDC